MRALTHELAHEHTLRGGSNSKSRAPSQRVQTEGAQTRPSTHMRRTRPRTGGGGGGIYSSANSPINTHAQNSPTNNSERESKGREGARLLSAVMSVLGCKRGGGGGGGIYSSFSCYFHFLLSVCVMGCLLEGKRGTRVARDEGCEERG